jgi:glycosyltransferase involved in cell wall biosynthesis
MQNLVHESPITKHFNNVHLIPFGIDLDLYKPRNDKQKIREKLGIPIDDIVIMFRSENTEYKGLSRIQKMIDNLKCDLKISFITVACKGLVKPRKYNLLEFGWTDDEHLMSDLYIASDVFLMPSVAEAFGMMAIEAMASGIPIIVFEGTALPSVTFAPQYGIEIKNNNIDEFIVAVKRLIENQNERIKRGKIGRTLAEKHYNVKDYVRRHIELYEDILKG